MRPQSIFIISVVLALSFDFVVAREEQASALFPGYHGNRVLMAMFTHEEYNQCISGTLSPGLLVGDYVVLDYFNTHGHYPSVQEAQAAAMALLDKIERNELPSGDFRYGFLPQPRPGEGLDCTRLRRLVVEHLEKSGFSGQVDGGNK